MENNKEHLEIHYLFKLCKEANDLKERFEIEYKNYWKYEYTKNLQIKLFKRWLRRSNKYNMRWSEIYD